MVQALSTSLNVVEIRERVLLAVRVCERTGRPWCSSGDRVSCQIEFLILTFVAFHNGFGIVPYPGMLLNLGWPGRVIHELFCTTAGMWEAFRRLVEWSHDLPWRTSLTEEDVVLHSVPEQFVYRALLKMSGVTRIEPHPCIPAGSGRIKCKSAMNSDPLRGVFSRSKPTPLSRKAHSIPQRLA